MKSALFIREFPDGKRKIFDSPEGFKSHAGMYFDDIAMNCTNDDNLVNMKYGHEQSAPGRIISERRTKDYILHYIIGGTGSYNGIKLTKNQGFITFPGEVHTIAADVNDPWHFLWLAIRGYNADYIIQNAGFSESKHVFDFDNAERVFDIFSDVIYTNHPGCDMETYMLGCFYLLTSYLKKESEKDDGTVLCRGEVYLLKAKRYMQKNFSSISVSDVAEHLHISRKYLTSIFNKYEKCSPQMYLTNMKINIASALLRETLTSVADIGKLVGFDDYTHFYKLFKKYKGMSPRRYRDISG